MNTLQLVIILTNHNDSTTCLHEDQIQHHSRKIERLEARADFKEQRIDDLSRNQELMNQKLDEILKIINEDKIESNKQDTELELRLKTIESNYHLLKQKMELQEKNSKDMQSKYLALLATVTAIFGALTFYFNFIH